MKAAGSAMTQIHGKMTIDKVDETMYVFCLVYTMFFVFVALKNNPIWPHKTVPANGYFPGTNSENSINSARKLPKQSQTILSANSRTKTNWTQNWKVWSRRTWTSECSRQGQSLWETESTNYPPLQMESVRFHFLYPH